MHELSIMQNILDIALDYASKNNAKKITKINLEIGELSGIIPDWMQNYFDFLTEGTIAYKAEIFIEWIPALIKCKTCDYEFKLTKENPDFACPVCKNTSIQILSGKDYFLKSIEVE